MLYSSRLPEFRYWSKKSNENENGKEKKRKEKKRKEQIHQSISSEFCFVVCEVVSGTWRLIISTLVLDITNAVDGHIVLRDEGRDF